MAPKKIVNLIDRQALCFNEAMNHFNLWLRIWGYSNNKKRGWAWLTKKMSKLYSENYDIYALFSFEGSQTGKFIGVSGSARDIYGLALNNDLESFRVVRMKRQGETLYFNYEPEGWLFSNNIRRDDWYNSDGYLNEEVKQDAVTRLERNLSIPEI